MIHRRYKKCMWPLCWSTDFTWPSATHLKIIWWFWHDAPEIKNFAIKAYFKVKKSYLDERLASFRRAEAVFDSPYFTSQLKNQIMKIRWSIITCPSRYSWTSCMSWSLEKLILVWATTEARWSISSEKSFSPMEKKSKLKWCRFLAFEASLETCDSSRAPRTRHELY